MERVISENEKMRRAEEIYNRRREQTVRVPTSKVNKKNNNSKKGFNKIQKLILQVCVCILIYVSLYIVQNSNYIFSENVINKAKDILYYDINFQEKTGQLIDYVKNSPLFGSNQGDNGSNGGIIVNDTDSNAVVNNTIENSVMENNLTGNSVIKNSVTENNVIENNITENNLTQTNSTSNELNAGSISKNEVNVINAGVGGAEENATLGESETVKYITAASSYNQMQIDADAIKKKFTLQLPLKSSDYTISSPFGVRTGVEPTFHTGIDMAANTGTLIYSAMDGTVILNSSEGDYGNHLEIQSGDLITLYGHCSKLLVKKGAKVKKGDKIAEVGSTGNSTGPHLHFEITYQGRYVNPEYVMKF
ncbi:MAG: M23 family metallopeptidase [Oscillospiraceae bacterium]|nr:M23 family metallopeptidase [Oscillospiraceae bacterium]